MPTLIGPSGRRTPDYRATTPRGAIGPSALVLVLVVVLTLAMVAGFVVLAIAGIDTGSYLAFVAGPIVTTVVGGLLAQRVGRAAEAAHDDQQVTRAEQARKTAAIVDYLEERAADKPRDRRRPGPPAV